MPDKEITHEGETYILKSSVDAIISKRLSTYSNKINAKETELAELQAKFDEQTSQLALSQGMQQRVSELETQLQSANTRYDRHSVLSGIGVNDDSVRATFEHIYTQQAGEQQFAEWVNAMKQDPSTAPLILQSFLGAKQEQSPQAAAQPPQAQPPQAQPPQPTRTPPPSNNGVIQTTQGNMSRDELLNRAADPAFYRANRDAIIKVYQSGQQATQPRI